MRGALTDTRRPSVLASLLTAGLLLGGCGPRPHRAPASAPASQPAQSTVSPYANWWTALDPSAAGYRVTKSELIAVIPPKNFERRALTCEVRSPVHWACATGRLPFALRVDGPNLLLEAPDGVVRARVATAEEAAAFEAEVARHPDLATACAKAKRCFMASCEIRGLTDCNFASETDGTSLRQCEGTRDGILVNLQDAKMPIPEDCQGPPVPKD